MPLTSRPSPAFSALRTGVLFALGFPAAIWNVTAGQNGFLTAALIGGTLGLLERHPALAGICLGLLTYKPQFGLLFPIVLIADRRWLTIAVAALVALLLAALSWLAFGSASWAAFVHWAPISNRVLIDQGALDWYRLQSVFALVRAHGGSETLAWIVQGVLTLLLAVGLAWLWKSRVAFELKAAALAAGALLATPYLFMYDLVVLAVAVAFLLRLALSARIFKPDRDRCTRHGRRADPDLPLREDPGRPRRGRDRHGFDRASRQHPSADRAWQERCKFIRPEPRQEPDSPVGAARLATWR